MRWHPRGVLPAVSLSTLSYWHLNDEVVQPALDFGLNATADPLTQAALSAPAHVISGPGRLARRFDGLSALYGTANDAVVRAAMLGEWTIQVCFRRAFATSAVRTLFSYGGSGTTSGAENILVDIRVTTGDAIEIRTQSGTNSNATVTPGSASYIVPFGEWNLIAVRKESAGVGLFRYRLFANGREMGVSAGIAAPDGGANANASLGSIRGSAPPAQAWVGDIAFVKFDEEQLADETIARDFARLIGVGFEVRDDYALEIEDGNGDRQEMTDLHDVDWVTGFSLRQSRSEDVLAALSVDMLGSMERLSLHQLRTESRVNLTDLDDVTSYDPLIDYDRDVELWFAQVPRSVRAYPDELQSRFAGTIDLNDETVTGMKIEARDLSSVLVDTFAEQVVAYGANNGTVDMEEAAQSFLDDNDNSTANDSEPWIHARPGSYDPITLYLRDSRNLMLPVGTVGGPTTGWAIALGAITREPIIVGLRNLFAQLAWNVALLYDQAAGAWRVAGYEPRREQQHPSIVLDPDRILDIKPFRRDVRLSRTVFTGRYGSRESTLPVPAALPAGFTGSQSVGWFNLDGRGGRSTAYYRYVEDDAHNAGRRRRYFEFTEPSASQVDTVDEIQRMVLGAAADIRDPEIAAAVQMPLQMSIELDDLSRLLPNVLSTGDQFLAVQDMTHSGGARAETAIGVGGKARAAFARWWQLEARPGVGKPGVLDPTDAAQIRLLGDEQQTLTTIIDGSDILSGGRFLRVKNGEFASFSAQRANLPDSWRFFVIPTTNVFPLKTWPADVDSVEDSMTGRLAVRMRANLVEDIGAPDNAVAQWLASSPVPLEEGQPFQVAIAWRPDSNTGDTILRYVLRWLDESGAQIGLLGVANLGQTSSPPSGWDIAIDYPAPGAWITTTLRDVLPVAGARFVEILLSNSTTTTLRNILVDSVGIARSMRSNGGFLFSGLATASSMTWRAMDGSPILNGGNVGIDRLTSSSDPRFVILVSGRYEVIFEIDSISGVGTTLAQFKSSANGGSYEVLSPAFTVSPGASGAGTVRVVGDYVIGDVIRGFWRTDATGSTVVVAMSISQISAVS